MISRQIMPCSPNFEGFDDLLDQLVFCTLSSEIDLFLSFFNEEDPRLRIMLLAQQRQSGSGLLQETYPPGCPPTRYVYYFPYLPTYLPFAHPLMAQLASSARAAAAATTRARSRHEE